MVVSESVMPARRRLTGGLDGRRYIFLILLVSLVAAGPACNRDATPVPVPTPIAPPTVTEHYTGTLYVLGNNLHSFQVTQSSEVDVTLLSVMTTAAPAAPVTSALTLTVGQPTLTTVGVQCSNLMQVVAPPGASPQLKGQALAGTYCVSISDPNSVLPGAVTYAITVAHS